MTSASHERDNGTTLPLAFKALLRNTRQPVFLIDSNACLLKVNPAFEDFFGTRSVEASGVPWRDVVGYPTDNICPATATMLDGQELSGLEFRSVIQGTWRRLSLTLSPLGDVGRDQPRCLGILDDLGATTKVGQDDTERYRFFLTENPDDHAKETTDTEHDSENQSQNTSERRFRRLAEGTSDIVMATDLNGHITHVSATVQRLFGYLPEKVTGRFLTEFVPANATAQIASMLTRVARGHTIEGMTSKMCRKDGQVALIDVNAMPVFENSVAIGAQFIIRDVSTIQRMLELD